jgi:hypothetical protein
MGVVPVSLMTYSVPGVIWQWDGAKDRGNCRGKGQGRGAGWGSIDRAVVSRAICGTAINEQGARADVGSRRPESA